MTPLEQKKAAAEFAEEWAGQGSEKSQTQKFWLELLQKVFGVDDPYHFITFEDEVMVDNTNFMDAYIESTKVLIEQKSIDKDLGKGIRQSNGETITPFLQARKYISGLPKSKHPDYVVTCNFREFWVYDMERVNDEPQKIYLADLEKEYYRLSFLVESGNAHLEKEKEVSFKAGQLVGVIYDHLLKQYIDADKPETLRSLNVLCVRLVFCLYAEDAMLFGGKTAFHDYLVQYQAKDLRRALMDLFDILDTPEDKRDPYIDESLKKFPYVNGGLFSHDEQLVIPQFTEELKSLLLAKASDGFDWSEISPTIFGAVFESTLNPETRRSGGMHYTSIENIHKVIDPLFLGALNEEFETIKRSLPKPEQSFATARKVYELPLQAKQSLLAFQDKLASLTFFDPACGSGNFLTESYVSLRRLENEVIRVLYGGQAIIGQFANPIKVNIHQFYGIEINDFAISVATTALWIAEQQMLQETLRIASFDIKSLPLKPYHNIHEGNALRIDWAEVIAPEKLNYIMGNPPFVGARLMSKEQKDDMIEIFGKNWDGVGNLDYVCAWYKKSADMMNINPNIRAALVSTNSITQGASVPNLWWRLFKRDNVQFDFAYRTFRWDSESSLKAAVHCVIIGFSNNVSPYAKTEKKIYISDLQCITASNINGYLMDAPDIWVDSRSKALCNVPPLLTGSQRIDDDLFMFNDETKAEFISKEPQAEKYFRIWYGADEFLYNRPRWVLYLGNCSPEELISMPHCYEIVRKVREYRSASKREQTLRAANYPNRFGLEVIPESNFMIVPVVSSEKRKYIPIGFMTPDVMCSNQVNLIPNATLYHFGILTSNVHMAWVKVVCGRLELRYRYSKDIVYNNFPWPNPTEEQKTKIEQTAQAILDARAKYPDCSLAALYDDVTMPPELRTAHQQNDKAVMQAYGFIPGKTSESDCVAELFKLYQELTK